MTQDMTHTNSKVIKVLLVATLTLLTCNNAFAQVTQVTVNGNVYGGGNLAEVKGSVTVNIKAGIVVNDVYGGGALANTNTNNWNDSELTDTYHGVTLEEGTSLVGYYYKEGNTYKPYTEGTATENTTYYKKTETIVNLTGGTIGNAYGGGLGQKNGVNGATSDVEALVYGDVLVNVNGTKFTQESDTYKEGTGEDETTVKVPKTGRVFGCNNLNGSPKKTVTVHVYQTNPVGGGDHQTGQYEIAAVYGGGNEAAYEPIITGTETAEAHAHTNVIIDGCSLTSIKQVYGGGNAASTPSTQVTINGAFEIDEVFGGGNGNDKIKRTSGSDVSWIDNGGANVGFYAYDADSEDYDTPTEREAMKYGFGKAQVNIGGGNIHAVYGGSNAKGNVRLVAVAMLEKTSEEDCFTVDEAYGGGKAAPMDGRAELQLGCIPGVGTIYGGARAADVNNDVVLTVTNGTFNRVFGGNNESGVINGTITVNIEETGCTPIVIGQLFGGGNQAAYEAPLKTNSTTERENGPTLNIKSCTSVGEIYGGGFGSTAIVTGDTYININEIVGAKASAYTANTITINEGTPTAYTVSIPAHTSGEIGAIGDVYGGGYGANVTGNTNVNIGTQSTVAYVSGTDHADKPVVGANITGNVFGGGFGASTNLTGTATVNIGEVLTEEDTETHVVTITGYKNNNATFANDKGIYGGSALGTVATTQVNLYAGTIAANVYGGGKGQLAQAAVTDPSTQAVITPAVEAQGATISTKATVNLYSATVTGNIYGGCNDNGTTEEAELNLIGGTIGNSSTSPIEDKVFGGGKGQLTTTTTTTVNVGKVTTTTGENPTTTYSGTCNIYSNVYGGSALGAVGVSSSNEVIGSATVNLYQAASVTGDVFGDGMGYVDADATKNVKAKMGNSTVYLYDLDLSNSNIYGGCNYNGTVYGKATVNLIGGSVVDVYGGGQGQLTAFGTAGSVEVNVGTDTSTGTTTITGDIYGGSAFGGVNSPTVNIYSATSIGGNVFGGGKGQLADNTTNPATPAITASVTGTTIVNMMGATVPKAIFGGCNLNGTSVDTEIYVTGGAVGSTTKTDGVLYGVFGGGYGQNTSVTGDVTVNIGKTTTTGTGESATTTISGNATVNGDVYGGSAQGSVNKDEDATTKTTSTTVHLYAGTVNGDVYGGGLGVKSETSDIPAQVYGNVLVDLNNHNGTCAVTGGLFGCNNANGSPEGDAEVHIYKTIGMGSNVRSTGKDNTTYDLSAVYGGGNKATYSASGKTAKVIIETCDVSINEVYGGGYGADVPNTRVEVNGAYEIGTVFGGGYGAGSDDPTAADYNPGANVNGSTDVILKGGVIHEVYGGSNTKGNIQVASNVNISDGSGCCDLKVDNIYGGGKNANMTGGANIILGCQPNTWIEDIYAGSREADVDGDVSLTITSGKFERVFGGNKTSGKLKGAIKVNIEETGDCGTPIIIGELYAGGNEADYSIYGYKDDGTPMTADELRTKLTTDNPGMTEAQIDALFQTTKKAEPQLNVRAFTSIGAVYGGGYSAKMYADPTVSINVVKGSRNNDAALAKGNTPTLNLPYPAHAKGAIGAIGNVFGGGNLATVYGSTTVNIGTETTVGFVTEPAHYRPTTAPDVPLTKNTETGLYDITVEGANITGNVFGGGQLADVGQYDVANDHVDVVGNTYVNIGAKKSGENYIPVAEGASKVLIGGNVFGGGEGEAAESGAGAFKCAKAIVTGGTNIHIGNGTINGTVYGGGEVGRVEGNSVVAIGIGAGSTPATSAPEIKGDVFGAGKGKKTHGYSALMRGNPTVTIEGDAKVRGSIYGGGEIASVGRYNVKKGPNNPVGAPDDVLVGMPYSLANSGSGYCTIIIQGNAEIGPETEMKMKTTSGIPDDTGHVIGGGKGVLPYDGYGVTDDDWIADPWRVSINDQKDIFNSTTYGATYEKEYFKYIETLALATETNVTIAGNAFVKGSVYGGSLNGHVQHDTHVNIAGGQIGQGEGVTKGRYETADWASTSLAECPHWDYVANSGAPYDPLATASGTYEYTKYSFVPTDDRKDDSDGGLPVAKDGHTYYGNVFGGGSGVIPYAPGLWHRGAGSVGGDTYVNITGGHILSSVYGGNEHTDVGTYTKDASGQPTTTPAASNARGKCTVNMTGGTVGVPRTAAEKQAYPLVGNVFGAGKGDQRIFFNTWTNVINTEVNISGDARIYGSVFGGGEDGHVISDAKTNIGNVTTKTGKDEDGDEITASATATNGLIIGTTGTSYSDGNVFGGGRGFSGEAQTAGTVGGNVEVNINAGSVYGSVYGGGRLASVGTMFEFPTLSDGSTNPAYGQFKEDGGGKTYGHVTINISGGTIGNENATGDGAKYSGNVFGGSMGRLTLLNGDTNPIWPKMAQVKETNVNIYGMAVVRRSVYGGGELGTVRDDAYVTIGGYKTADADSNGDVAVTTSAGDATNPTTVRRDVYGGGYGSDNRDYTIFTIPELKSATADPTDPNSYESHTYAFTPMQFAGCVGQNTYVNVAGGYIRKSVYGGGEMASVGVINYRAAQTTSEPAADKVKIGPIGGKTYYYEHMVKHGDPATGFALSWPYEFEYVDGYPGATHVKVTGGRLGLKTDRSDDDATLTDNGDVYGAGKGMAGDYKDYVFCANVGSTDVKIAYGSTPTAYSDTGDCIAGAVYGGGEDGHVMGDTKLTISGGLIYHSVYGGGSGKGKFTKSLAKTTNVTIVTNNTPTSATTAPTQTSTTYDASCYSITAGKVFGNTEVVMSDGYVVRNIYGGGNMGSVGKGNYAGGSDDYSTSGYGEKVDDLWSGSGKFSEAFLNSGKCKVKISGGTIGYIDTTTPSNSMYPWNSSASLPYGNVFGGCRGESAPNIVESPRYLYSPEFFVGYANETEVTIEGDNTKILGSVYGGGMDGHVRRDAHVIIKGGEIGIPFTDPNKTSVQTDDPNDIQWLTRGNVYGAGSGIGKYKYDFNYDGDYLDEVDYKMSETRTVRTKEEDFSTSAGSVTRFTKVEIQGGTIHRNVYGGGSLSTVGAPKIGQSYDEYRKGDTATDHGVGKQTLNEVIISGGQIGDALSYNTTTDAHVYGGHVYGGSRGDLSLSNAFSTALYTDVKVNGDADIKGDVYGGGEAGTVKGDVDVNITGGTVGHDVYGGGALADTQTSNWNATGGNDGNGDWTDATNKSALHKTTVNLLGGTISGDAYGGGLGQLGANPIPAKVYGDVNVTLDGSAFNISYYDGAHSDVVKSGRVFGSNNLNGSPQGNVTVTVNKTVKGNVERTAEDPDNPGKAKKGVTSTYEVAAVYGGGNLADYTPALARAKTNVKIMTCDVSIQEVYGGGNAAAVPETDVLVNGAYEIEYVFGGGNGEDPYTLDGGTTWIANKGANIGLSTTGDNTYGSGNTNTLLKGGYIHEAYGGSNVLGNIKGTVVINAGSGGDCTLDCQKIVAAGRNANLDGDAILIMGCVDGAKVDQVIGGADNANVNGNVELTITSGTFGKVFGGNNLGGIIKGHIKLNIEETNCTPIKIDELYLGGNKAAYSIYGYYDSGETNSSGKPIYLPRTSENDEHTAVENPADDATHSFPYAEPELNIISCTYIGKVFGGGLGKEAVMYADPTVNINMIPGVHAGDAGGVPTVMTSMQLDPTDNPDKLGIIGDVYGGGNEADVVGNPTVNIGTAETVTMTSVDDDPNTADVDEKHPSVLGAYITGNVFGGGMGKDDTFTCEKAMIGKDGAGAIDADGDGNLDTDGGTTVNIYKGLVLGNVYGGGEVGRVEKNTVVTIGTGDGVDVTTGTPTSAPEIRGSVFGGGKGLETHGYSALVRGNPTVVVQGNAKVRGNVYGGGQIASVARYNVAKTDDEGAPYGVKKDMPYALRNNNSGFCTVTIKGYAEIGPETIGEGKTTSVGHVFGAGKGILPNYVATGTDEEKSRRMVLDKNAQGEVIGSKWEYFATEADYITFVKTLALASEATVNIDGNAKVKGSVFGGSESGFVQFDTNVNVAGGTIGTQGKGGADFGNVYGGGKGDVEYTGVNHDYITAGIVKGNTKVVISQAEGKTTKILHNVYGGGAYGTVGEFEYDGTTGMPTARKTYTIGSEVHNTTGGKAEIYITGGTIGTNGNENGMIFGSSRGDVGAPGSIHDKAAWVYDTHVAIGDTTANATITTATPLIKGSVYGGGENGHNFHSSYVRINGGTIGITEGEPIGSYTAGGASYPYRGNVYGGGCGTDMYDSDNDGTEDSYNPLAGIVQGDATIRMTAGTVAHNMYGAGAMGSVGNFEKDATTNAITFTSGGTTTIAISGGTIGVDGTAGEGCIYGAARGDKAVTDRGLGLVKETSVTISGTTTQIKGNVYGGGEVGNVHTNTRVNIQGGVIAKNVFGGGKGVEDLFTCEQAMVGVDGDGAGKDLTSDDNKDKGTIVTISNGTVGTLNGGNLVEGTGNVYGGGEIGRVEWNTQVKIGVGTGEGTFEPTIYGNVFGAGKGLETHGYSALVRGNSTVTIQGGAKIGENIYGGGEMSTVGRYWVKGINNNVSGAPTAPTDLPDGMPYQKQSGGICRVTIQGNAEIGTNGTDDKGHVFGAGKGVDSHFAASTSKKKIGTNELVGFTATTDKTAEELYYEFLQTLALVTETHVTIDESAHVNGSVFGGSESGFVQANTNVTIQGNNSVIGTTTYGNVFGGGKGLEYFAEAGKVKGNTTVAISNGTVKGNVYGGGRLGDVGIIDKTDKKDGQLTYNNKWKKTDGTTANDTEINKKTDINTNTGICKVTISGGTIGVENPDDATKHGNVFGAGRGSSTTWWCEKAIAYASDVNITKGTVYGNVYGGGQVGRVEDDAKVTIGTANGTDDVVIKGSVFGAGAGLATHGYSALVRGNADVTVQGKAQIGGSVYGGGETASVGRFTVVGGLPKHPDSGGTCTIVIKDNAAITGEVFGACKGVDPSTIAVADRKSMQLYTNRPTDANLWSRYNNDDNSPFIWRTYSSEADYLAFLETLALTSNTDVTISGSATINESVYGGGQRGITLGSVKVDVTGGTVNKDVYGGGALANTNKGNWDDGKGTWADGKTSADYTTTVNLLGGTVHDVYGGGLGDSNTPAIVYGDVKVNLNDIAPTEKGCVIKGNLFGANNINGTPKGHVLVHVHGTQNESTTAINAKVNGQYDVVGVYGGGNAADYVPTDEAQSTEVIIEGCDLTSIDEVYGGGYGAATPATSVLVKGTKIINNVYGGGYGASTATYTNPGANVGYLSNKTSYGQGTGKAIVQLMAGTINNVYGGSNTKGDIRGGSSVTNVANTHEAGCCDKLSVGEIYGGGKQADMYGGAEIVLGCMPNDWIGAIYAGAENADIGGDVGLTLTSGKFERVFGGNNKGGKIDGYIEVNIEENPDCETPIIIGGLYGGGNMAPYTVPAKYTANNPNYQSPRVNVRAFTSIGNIYGGGFGANATVTGNPLVNINQVEGGREYAGETKDLEDGSKVTLYARSKDAKMGVIGNVFGGGNAAKVIGNTTVNIGTESEQQMVSLQTTDAQGNVTVVKKPVVGADIRGNVYGGGNNAAVVGKTDVVIGKEKKTTP